MNTAICYFSGTGNSRHAANRLAEAFDSATLQPIVGLLESDHPVVDADTVGIVFPIHAFTSPQVVEEFLRRVALPSASYVFALATRECSSRVAVRLDRLLQQQGKSLAAFYSVRGPQSYITVFPTATVEDASTMDRQLDSVIPTIVDSARKGDRRMPKDGMILGIVAGTLFRLMTWIYRRTDCYHLGDRFYADKRCTSCGTCVAVCPSQRIRIDEGVPVWDRTRPCLQCFACLHYCPEQAIQIRSSNTGRKARFHYPGIGHRAIAEQRQASVRQGRNDE